MDRFHANIPPGGSPPIPGTPPLIACAACGRDFPAENLIQLDRVWICAGCKPVLLQRLQEGVGMPKGAGTLWRKGKLLVTISETPFPDRCVKCNAPAKGYRQKIVFLAVGKKTVVHVGVCEAHQAVRRKAMWAAGIGALSGLAFFFGAVIFEARLSENFQIMGILLFMASVFIASRWGLVLSAGKITRNNVWLKGVHRDFLDTLPEWPRN